LKWTTQRHRQLKELWKDMTDKELGIEFNVSSESIRHQREALGLYRRRINDRFVVQVTEWLPRVSDTDCQCAHFRNRDIEHIVVRENNSFAIFRTQTQFLPVCPEPSKGAWVLHWKPLE